MDIIISLVAVVAILLAIASRIIEADRQEKKRIRILKRTNKVWSRK